MTVQSGDTGRRYKFASIGGDGPDGATWYDVAHVEGSPKAP
jgi:hypothetical protein